MVNFLSDCIIANANYKMVAFFMKASDLFFFNKGKPETTFGSYTNINENDLFISNSNTNIRCLTGKTSGPKDANF